MANEYLLSKPIAVRSPIFNIPVVMLSFIGAFLLHLVPLVQIKEGYYNLMIYVVLFVLIQFLNQREKLRSQAQSALLGILLFFIVHFLYHLAINYEEIREWDFICFYMFGKVGAAGSDFYDPQVFAHALNELGLQSRVGSNFIKEIVEVGFWYPPPSMFLFLPLGALDLQTGYIIWQSVFIFFLLIDVYLLIRFYGKAELKKQDPVIGLGFLLIMVFPNLTISAFYAQTAPLFLFLLIFLIRYRDHWRSGVLLALLVVIKPLAAVLLLYFLFLGKWKPILAAATTGMLILGMTVLAFGVEPLITYFKSPPTDRIPDFVYNEYFSWFAVLKRLQVRFPAYLSVGFLKILQYGGTLLFLAITFFASRRLNKTSPQLAFMIFLPLAMLVYPASLNQYSIMTLPVVMALFNEGTIKYGRWTLGLIFLFFGLCFYSFFLYNLLLWSILVTWPLLEKLVKKYSTSGLQAIPLQSG